MHCEAIAVTGGSLRLPATAGIRWLDIVVIRLREVHSQRFHCRRHTASQFGSAPRWTPSRPETMSELYRNPEEYDREHLGYDEDIAFYVSLVRKLRPNRVLELGCGTGRITIPLAETGSRLDFDVG